jgi:hypothetical protein
MMRTTRLVIVPNIAGDGFPRMHHWTLDTVSTIMQWCDIEHLSDPGVPVLVIGCPSLTLPEFLESLHAWMEWCAHHDFELDPTFSIFSRHGNNPDEPLNFYDTGQAVPAHILTKGFFADFNNRDEAWREYLSYPPLGDGFNLDRWNSTHPRSLEERFVYGDICRDGNDCPDEVVIVHGTSVKQAYRIPVRPNVQAPA